MFDSKIDRMINWLIDLIFPLLNLEMMKSNNSIRVFLQGGVYKNLIFQYGFILDVFPC